MEILFQYKTKSELSHEHLQKYDNTTVLRNSKTSLLHIQ